MKNKIPFVIAIPLAIIAFIFLWSSSTSQVTNVAPTKVDQLEVSTTTSDWKIFSASGYSINYPKDWAVLSPNSNTKNGVAFTGTILANGFTPNMSISLVNNQASGQADKMASTYSSLSQRVNGNVSTSTVYLNGIKGIRLESVSYKSSNSQAPSRDYAIDDIYVFMQNGSTVYSLEGSYLNGDQLKNSMFEQFINSFKFTN